MGIFHHSSSNHTCPAGHDLTENATEAFVANMTFYHFNMILSGACTIFSCIVMFSLMFRHATHLSKPNEQLKIINICYLIPIYGIVSFLQICFPKASVYIAGWLDVCQAIALGSFFLLLCEFVSPDDAQRDLFFAALRVEQKGKPASGLGWYRQKWIAIFQYPIIAFLCAIITDITQAAGIYCEASNKPYFVHLWILIAQNVSVVVAVLSVVRFYKNLKTELNSHRPLSKLLAFKLIVFTTFLERIIFAILKSTSVLKPSSTMVWGDWDVGVPAMIICIEMVPFSLFFHYAYHVKPYIINGRRQEEGLILRYQGGPLGIWGFLAALNPSDIFKAIFFAFTMATKSKDAKYQSLNMQSVPEGTAYQSYDNRALLR